MPTMELGRPVGRLHRPFVIAAVDATRLGTIEHALAAIDAAAAHHCDAVKLTSLPWTWCARLYNHADPKGIKLLTTVSDERSIERLDWYGTPAFEIFFDWADLDLVRAAARTGKPLVLSVVSSSEAEIAEVVALARREGAGGIALVQRVTDSALTSFDALRCHNTVVGISDHSGGSALVRSAIGRGARIVEKRLSPRMFSTDLAAVVRDCDIAWAMLGNVEEWTTN